MIDIVIVNWNSADQLRQAVESIVAFGGNLVKTVIVVDNNSSDFSLKKLELMGKNLSFSLKLIKNDINRGFGSACNQGAKLSTSDYLLFLNPDTRLFSNSLAAPLNFMRQSINANVGICGIQLMDEFGHVSRTCSRFPSVRLFASQAFGLNKISWLSSWSQHMGEWNHDIERDVDQVIGAFFFIRHSVFEQLQGFDERFFVYFEEVDVSYRALQAGWRSVYLVNAQAFHAGGGTSQQVKAARLFYSLRSRLLYGFKHFSRFSAWALLVVTLLVEPFSRAIFSFLRGGEQDIKNTIKGYGMLYQELTEILRVNKR